MPKRKLENTIKLHVYFIVSDAVERGCAAGIRKAHKHTNSPTIDDISAACHVAVMYALEEVLNFEDQ